MAFRFEKASSVVLGTFNTYILHPKWLADRNILEKGTEVLIEMNFEEPGLRYIFADKRTSWNIAPNRLSIESRDSEFNCGEVVAKILEILRYTPIYALGNNFEYAADLTEAESLAASIQSFPRPDSPNLGETVGQRTFHYSIKRSEHEATNIQLAIRDKDIKLACNVHTGLKERPDANEVAVQNARNFFGDKVGSKILAQHFFGTEVT